MKLLKLKRWIQNKIKYFNELNTDYIIKRFTYVLKAERLNEIAINSKESGVSDTRYCDNEIIVSLTTYGERLRTVHLSIESIMQQTIKPNKIILSISDDYKNSNIPQVLLNQQKRGLEINFCRDIKSYTKLIPALKKYPLATIITIDDDHLYNYDLIENLLNEHKKNPHLILAARIHRMKLRSDKKLEKYSKWIDRYKGLDISPLNFPTGIGGVLYPPDCFNEEVFNEEIFFNICKYADDVWFKAMALLNGTMSKKIFISEETGADNFCIDNTQNFTLSHINRDKNMNDIQLKAVFEKYNLYDKLI